MPPQTLDYPSRANGGADTAPQRLIVDQTDGHATNPDQLAEFGASLLQRFRNLGDLADINQAIECLSRAMQLTPGGHPARPARLNILGISYKCRFECLGELADIAEAIECLTQAVRLTPDGHPDEPSGLNNLGNLYCARFEWLGELTDVEKAIKCQTQAVQLTHDGHPAKPLRLDSLGNSYSSRFERLGELADEHKAIDCYTRAVQLTPDDHPRKSSWLHHLGVSHFARFERLGELVDMDKAIEWQTQAMQLTPVGHPEKLVRLNKLGFYHLHRFQRFGELADVEKAIGYETQGVELTPDDNPGKGDRLSNLGDSYMSRFGRLGELVDADKAIECLTQAVQLTPDEHPHSPIQLTNLGAAYMRRFERLRELADLVKAMERLTHALHLTPDGHQDKPSRLNNLGNSFTLRFEYSGELEYLTKAIECQTQALQLTPDGDFRKPGRLNNLGFSYMCRFERLGKLADVDKAIECQTQAVQLTHEGHLGKPAVLNNLGNSYRSRCERRGEPADATKAIEFLSQAVQLTPDGHPEKPTQLNNLGLSFRLRFELLGNPADLTHAQSIFQQGAQMVLTSPEPQLRCARNWAETTSLLGLSPQAAYERCFKLLPHLIWLGTTIDHRYSLLTKVNDLATEAASWAISVQLYDLACEWLEEGRSIVWNQILHLRTPLDHLSTVDPQLAQQLRDIASQLENAGSRQSAQSSSLGTESDLETAAQQHRRLADMWECCIAQARSIPGFHNFMQPRSASELKVAATDGPVIIINSYSTRWDALVVLPQRNDIVHVPLGKLPLNQAGWSHEEPYSGRVAGHRGERGRGFGRVKQKPEPEDPFKSVLVALWFAIVRPILDALGCERKISVAELPHVTWCATGSLAFLPLHAAGPYDGSSPNAFDLVISSYTPSLSALVISSPTPSQPQVRVLAVGQENTKGLCPLPNIVQELEAIRMHVHATCLLQLDGENASVNAVLNAMDQSSWVHLACHATQNPVNPIHSAFHLTDGDLTLERITKRQFKNKGLAFLSACQTAQGDGELPDEAVHLAAGMLMAGYPSVIATMWSIWDADGPEVAGRVYSELFKDGRMDHREAARALHKAVAGLREQVGEDQFERWVPFIHIGV